uniref:Uncharacterized protein n=1 Tax=Rhizophora mucronata TaxID=61149 RepID=A0A2P2PTJ5_RHIMU
MKRLLFWLTFIDCGEEPWGQSLLVSHCSLVCAAMRLLFVVSYVLPYFLWCLLCLHTVLSHIAKLKVSQYPLLVLKGGKN